MSNILFFDTETNDFTKTEADGSERARIVQLASLFIGNNSRSEINLLAKPDGWEVAERCFLIHGISTEDAEEKGMPIDDILMAFDFNLNNADLLVAHNIDFDYKIIRAEYLRAGMDTTKLDSIPKYCTMKSTTNFCAISNSFASGFKWPKLSELHKKLFGKDFEGAHDAMNDVLALERCYFEYQKLLVK